MNCTPGILRTCSWTVSRPGRTSIITKALAIRVLYTPVLLFGAGMWHAWGHGTDTTGRAHGARPPLSGISEDAAAGVPPAERLRVVHAGGLPPPAGREFPAVLPAAPAGDPAGGGDPQPVVAVPRPSHPHRGGAEGAVAGPHPRRRPGRQSLHRGHGRAPRRLPEYRLHLPDPMGRLLPLREGLLHHCRRQRRGLRRGAGVRGLSRGPAVRPPVGIAPTPLRSEEHKSE